MKSAPVVRRGKSNVAIAAGVDTSETSHSACRTVIVVMVGELSARVHIAERTVDQVTGSILEAKLLSIHVGENRTIFTQDASNL